MGYKITILDFCNAHGIVIFLISLFINSCFIYFFLLLLIIITEKIKTLIKKH